MGRTERALSPGMNSKYIHVPHEQSTGSGCRLPLGFPPPFTRLSESKRRMLPFETTDSRSTLLLQPHVIPAKVNRVFLKKRFHGTRSQNVRNVSPLNSKAAINDRLLYAKKFKDPCKMLKHPSIEEAL